jgi:ABC-type polysaccharide/polyol phosphate export permease
MNRLKRIFALFPHLLLRDLKERYAGSVIGVFWTFLQPLLFILLFWVVFSQIMRIRIHTETGQIPFIAFLLSGLLPWFAFHEGVMRGSSSIVERRQIIKKVMFPAELFPITSVISSFIHYGVGMLIFLCGFFIWKKSVSLIQIPLILILLLIQIMLTTGITLILSSLTVYIRDVVQFLGLVLQAFFYLSTILYPITSVPEGLRVIIRLNPVTSLAEAYHNIILYGKIPESIDTLYLLLLTIMLFFGGIFFFRKLKRGFADVL